MAGLRRAPMIGHGLVAVKIIEHMHKDCLFKIFSCCYGLTV
jgi:hypothetical protein